MIKTSSGKARTCCRDCVTAMGQKTKQNCWEFKRCGREPGGSKCGDMGVCPAASDASFDGLNGGKNGGRICWAAAGTFSSISTRPCYVEKNHCVHCDFFGLVEKEEGIANFVLMKPGQIFYH